MTKCRDFPNHVCNKVKKGQCETMDKETFKTSQRTDSQCHFSPILNARIYQCVKVRGTFKSKAPLRVQFSPALGGRGWERVKAEASPRLY